MKVQYEVTIADRTVIVEFDAELLDRALDEMD